MPEGLEGYLEPDLAQTQRLVTGTSRVMYLVYRVTKFGKPIPVDARLDWNSDVP